MKMDLVSHTPTGRSWRAVIGIALLWPALAAAQDAPGGVSTGMTIWYDAGSGIPQNAANVTANWTKRGGTTAESPLTRQGTTGTIDALVGAVNFNPVLDFNNAGNLGTGRFYGGAATQNRNWITLNNAGSAFGAGEFSDQLSFLGRGLSASCTADAARCDVGFRQDVASNTGTSFGGNPSNTAYANGTAPGNLGPTTNVYGLWAISGAGNHRNTRNGWTATGTGVTKEIASDYQFRIGSFPGFTANNLIAEVVYYDRKVTETEAQQITTYFGVKYGVTLESDATRNNTVNFDYLSSSGTVVWAAAARHPITSITATCLAWGVTVHSINASPRTSMIQVHQAPFHWTS